MSKQNEAITAVYADEDGNILDAPGMRGMGRTGRMNVLLQAEDLIPLPESADLMLLPDRLAVGQSADGETMPISGFAVAAILPAGYTRLYMPAYELSLIHILDLVDARHGAGWRVVEHEGEGAGHGELEVVLAVSYTHLDVYKRQTQGLGARDACGGA